MSEKAEKKSDLITELVNWDFDSVSLIKGHDNYSPDKFLITKSRDKYGSLIIKIVLDRQIEKILLRQKKLDTK